LSFFQLNNSNTSLDAATLKSYQLKSKKTAMPTKPVRVIDERDQVWSSVDNLTVGMTPEERSKKLREFVDSLPKVKKPEQDYDWLEDAMKCNPTLTREEAIEMAREFGF
jgi:hypothetical protein